MKRLRNVEETEDLLQELFIRVEKYVGEEEIINVRSFVYRIANNLAIDRLRQKKMIMSHSSGDETTYEEVAAPLPAADQVVYDRSRLHHLQDALNKLPEKQRKCFILHRCDSLTYQEVGDQIGLSASMVKKHVIKTLAYCRKYMRRMEG